MSDFNWLMIDHKGFVSMFLSRWEAEEAMMHTVEALNREGQTLNFDEQELFTIAEVKVRVAADVKAEGKLYKYALDGDGTHD